MGVTGSLFLGATATAGPGPPHYRCLTITLRHITVGVQRPSTRQHTRLTRDIHSPAGFKPTISATSGRVGHALDGTATGIGVS